MYGISLDIGTSGIRGHAIELSSGKIISTAITEGHPLPGANVMDHLTFTMRMGIELAHDMLMNSVNKVINDLQINLGRVKRVGICGNPIQLSIFQNVRVEDLAYSGERAKRMGIVPRNRNARTIPACDVGLEVPDRAELIIPPGIRNGIGTDALAMLIQSGFLKEKGNSMITDYGTHAEMALKVGDVIYIGSAATAPSIEGQHIRNGMLTTPGAISDMEYDFHWRCKVLDRELIARDGDLLDLPTETLISEGPMHRKAKGITGTGMIGILAAVMNYNLRRKGKMRMPKGRIDLQDGLFVTSDDLMDVCKAMGAIRAGQFSLIENAGIRFDELPTMYMSGAAGTYVDAVKARDLGMMPPLCTDIYQTGNTSLMMADAMVMEPGSIDKMQKLADGLKVKHIDFSSDETFEQIYVQELAYWDEGMSMEMYNENLEMAGIQHLPRPAGIPNVHRTVLRDIPVIGDKGLMITKDNDMELMAKFGGCLGCRKCQKECPQSALKIGSDKVIRIRTRDCLGASCYRCQYKCPIKVFEYAKLHMA